jgi:glyoxylase-like metal-dependent hydrolase (beta-lactamase superfamily II)
MRATVEVLVNGRVSRENGGLSVESTISLVRDGSTVAIIDPGMVADRAQILDPLRALRVDPGDVTDVILSHHHPDHTLNAALFLNARIRDHWAIYHRDRWISRSADGEVPSPSIRLIVTPGHTPQDITTLVGTSGGTVAFTHAWHNAQGPEIDPYADMDALRLSRARILSVADLIVPGHGAPFIPDASTPR